jgi:hypothetical protein
MRKNKGKWVIADEGKKHWKKIVLKNCAILFPKALKMRSCKQKREEEITRIG